jgi:hypothetical protein
MPFPRTIGVHADPVFVDQPVLHERDGEVGTAEDINVLAGLLISAWRPPLPRRP